MIATSKAQKVSMLEPILQITRERSVRIALAFWFAINLVIVTVGWGELPFDRPLINGQSFAEQVSAGNIAAIEVLGLMALIYWVTRQRAIPNLAARAPGLARTRLEVAGLIAYGIGAQVAGYFIGNAEGGHPYSFHLVGSIYGTHASVETSSVIGWATFNFLAYVVIPMLWFRRHYSPEALSLRSSDRAGDLLVIALVLVIESIFQLVGLGDAIVHLDGRQLAIGVPVAFLVNVFGTALPTMVFIYCLLLPRYARLTGSITTAVILGGLTYAALHFFDGWVVYDSWSNAVLSICSLLTLYFVPGVMKGFLTARTGNAWVHLFAYHAIAPHVLEDTPHMVEIFKIK